MWNASTGTIVKNFTGHKKDVSDLSLSKCGNYLYSSSDDSTVKCWDVRKGNLLHSYCAHKIEVNCCVISQKNDYLVSASDHGAIKVWSVCFLPPMETTF